MGGIRVSHPNNFDVYLRTKYVLGKIFEHKSPRPPQILIFYRKQTKPKNLMVPKYTYNKLNS